MEGHAILNGLPLFNTDFARNIARSRIYMVLFQIYKKSCRDKLYIFLCSSLMKKSLKNVQRLKPILVLQHQLKPTVVLVFQQRLKHNISVSTVIEANISVSTAVEAQH